MMEDDGWMLPGVITVLVLMLVCVEFESLVPVFIALGLIAIAVVGFLVKIAIDAHILRKNRRRDRAEEAAKAAQEATEALLERALRQHVMLEMGLVDNRPDKIVKGIHGDYLPYQLDWPKEVA